MIAALHRDRAISIADQLTSSLGNVGVTLIVAHACSARGFGTFALALTVYTFLVGLSRSVATDPLIVRFSDGAGRSAQRRGSEAVGVAAVLGCLGAAICALAAVVTQQGLRYALLGLALTLPITLVQDALRFVAMARRDPATALANDAIWTATSLLGCLVAFQAGSTTPAVFLVTWGATSAAGAIYGLVKTNTRLQLRGWRSWVSMQRDLSGPFSLQFLAETGAIQISMIAVTAFAGLTAVAALRVCQTIFGPMTVLWSAAQFLLLPEIARLGRGRFDAAMRLAWRASGLLVTAAGVWIAGLLLVPNHVMAALFQASWVPAESALIPYSVFIITAAGMTGPAIALRGCGFAREALTVALTQLPLVLVGPALGGRISGGRGAASGLAAAGLLSVALWSRKAQQLRRVRVDRHPDA